MDENTGSNSYYQDNTANLQYQQPPVEEGAFKGKRLTGSRSYTWHFRDCDLLLLRYCRVYFLCYRSDFVDCGQ